MAQTLVNHGIPAHKITIIPNWADYEMYEETSTVTPTEKKGKGPLFVDSQRRFRILYAGSVGRLHPIIPIFEAAEILQKQEPDIEFVFVTDGESQERLAKERTKRSLENIRLMPLQPNIKLKEMMESGDVHLISLVHDAEGLAVPSKLYPALAAARPVIFFGSDQSEVAHTLLDFSAGTTIDTNNPIDLANMIKNYRHDAALWFSAHEGAAHAGNVFVPAQSTSAMIERFNDMRRSTN